MRFKVVSPLVTFSVLAVAWACLASPPARAPAKPADAAAQWKTMFPDGLIDANGNAVDVAKLSGKIVGVYFSAHWCAPCKLFTPLLAAFRAKNAANFEVVFVSADRSKEEHRKYMSEAAMRWPAVEWKTAASDAIIKQFEIKSIPALIILGPDGKEITRSGKSDVANDANAPALTKWQKASK